MQNTWGGDLLARSKPFAIRVARGLFLVYERRGVLLRRLASSQSARVGAPGRRIISWKVGGRAHVRVGSLRVHYQVRS